MNIGKTLGIIASIGIVIIIVTLGSTLLAPYLRTQSAPPRLAAGEQEQEDLARQTEQEIVTGKLLVRLTPRQVLDIRSLANQPATPVPLATPLISNEPPPTALPSLVPTPTPIEASFEPSPSPAASVSPTPEETTSPTPTLELVPTPTPEASPEASPAPPNDGGVLGIQDTAPLPVLPDFAVIENIMEKVEFVTATAEQPAAETSQSRLTDLLRTKVAGEETADIPALDRWIVIDLKKGKGVETTVRVNNSAELVPIGEPILEPVPSNAPAPPQESTPKRASVSAEAEAAVAATRQAIVALRETQLFEHVEPLLAARTALVPNDPYFVSSGAISQPYDDLWGLKRIQAAAAWGASTGSPAVTIAIPDTGIDFTHRDLQGNFWENPGEVGNDVLGRDKKMNGVDDDANGYIDDWRGWDFYNNDNNPTDDNGHGTHVAGIIGARGNNGADIAGVMWNVKLMPLKFLSGFGSGTVADAAAALRYAADKGARVISNSWGGPGTSILLHDVVEYAHAKGSLITAAAGNEYCSLNHRYCWLTPAVEEKVIAVSASTPHDTKAPFSNHGNKVELAAPGGDWGDFEVKSILSLRAKGTGIGHVLNEHLTFAAGTSMATPYVSGVAGLVFALHPDWTNDQVRTHLQTTADDVGPPGRDRDFGYGLVNAARALGRDSLALNLTSPTTHAYTARYPNQKIDVVGTVGGPPLRGYTIESAPGGSPRQWTKIHEGTAPVTNALLTQWTPDAQPPNATFNIRLTANPGTPEQIQLLRRFDLHRSPAIYINNNDEVTQSRDTTLTIWADSGSFGTKQMRIRNAGEPWGAWQPYAEAKPWTLPVSNGLKVVEAEFNYGGPNPSVTYKDQIVFDPSGTTNRSPQVKAGSSPSVTLSQTASLDGTVTDDGRPTPPGKVTTTWSKVSGAGNVTFADPSAVDTTATFSATGSYQLQLAASDGQHTTNATTWVDVAGDAEPLSYLTARINRPTFGERRPTIPQELPLDVLFEHLSGDNLKCLTVKLDGTLVTPAADQDAYQQTNLPTLPAC